MKSCLRRLLIILKFSKGVHFFSQTEEMQEAGKRTGGLEDYSINSAWDGGKLHEIERERLLYRLMTIEQLSSRQGYFGETNCKICDLGTPYGSRSYNGVEWPINVHHYIEFHGHKPTDGELEAVESLFEELKERQQKRVHKNMIWIRNQKQSKK